MAGNEIGKIKYEVFGPFPFGFTKEVTHRQALNQFWAEREKDEHTKGLSGAVGVYVWTIRQGKRQVPWNVGLTDKQGFKVRFFQKEASFLKLLYKEPDAEIQVYLLALLSKTGKFKRPTNSKQISVNQWLETTLIGAAIRVNPNLKNKSKAGYLKRVVVGGYLNDENETSDAAKSFSNLFKV
jgi:hypothetical protein